MSNSYFSIIFLTSFSFQMEGLHLQFLQLLVENNLSSKICSYCKEESCDENSAPFDIVMQRIHETISTKYADVYM